VGKLAEANFALAVSNTVPARDVKSLVAHLKQNPGKFNFATPGNGTPQHLAMALFIDRYGVELAHVPYKGIGPALTELGGGTVEVMFATVHSVLPLVQAGKVRLLGVSGPARSPLVPDVPTFREQGVDMADGIDAWYGVLAPARTPPELVKRLNRDFTEVITSSEVKAQAAKQGITIDPATPAQLGELIKSDLKRWKKVVTDHHITAD
jgi:tripartite-type tricarboxylate transporter receptor subunit TctC